MAACTYIFKRSIGATVLPLAQCRSHHVAVVATNRAAAYRKAVVLPASGHVRALEVVEVFGGRLRESEIAMSLAALDPPKKATA